MQGFLALQPHAGRFAPRAVTRTYGPGLGGGLKPYGEPRLLSVKDRVVQAAAAGGVVVGRHVVAKIASNFDIKWFQIAVEHEQAALDAVARADAAPDGSREMGEAFDDELRAGMVVVAASAFAIDALYEKINSLLEPAARPSFSPGGKRPGRIVETFKAALELRKRAPAWQTEIPRLGWRSLGLQPVSWGTFASKGRKSFTCTRPTATRPITVPRSLSTTSPRPRLTESVPSSGVLPARATGTVSAARSAAKTNVRPMKGKVSAGLVSWG